MRKVIRLKQKNNDRGEESNHETGLAFDLGIVDPQTGNFDWNYDGNPQWNRLGEIGESLGLEWGGRWAEPYDPPHFQLRR